MLQLWVRLRGGWNAVLGYHGRFQFSLLRPMNGWLRAAEQHIKTSLLKLGLVDLRLERFVEFFFLLGKDFGRRFKLVLTVSCNLFLGSKSRAAISPYLGGRRLIERLWFLSHVGAAYEIYRVSIVFQLFDFDLIVADVGLVGIICTT